MNNRDVSTLDFDKVLENLKDRLKSGGRRQLLREMEQLQTAAYVMVGGGLLGRSLAEQPRDFYIDDRVSKRPYPWKAIANVMQVLVLYAGVLKLDPRKLPNKYFDAHASGVW